MTSVSEDPVETGRPAAASLPDPNAPLLYRLKLKTEGGALLSVERVRADTDEQAIALAMRRLVGAAIVEVWRHARWVAQVQRASTLN